MFPARFLNMPNNLQNTVNLSKKYIPVKPMKIKTKEYKGYYCRLWLAGHNSPFILKSAPLGKEWAHVLLIDNEPWQIYDFSEESCDSYKRMI